MRTSLILRLSLLLFLFGLFGCGSSPDSEAMDPESEVVTVWTDRFELFMEYPQLRRGIPARFAVHLTRLEDFQPVLQGPVRFDFFSNRQSILSVTEETPARPGIFLPEVTFQQSGEFRLEISIQSAAGTGKIEFGPLTVYELDDDLPAVSEVTVQGDRVAYLKEQQWKLPFRTEVAASRNLRETIPAVGRVHALPSRDFRVVPPLAGRFLAPDRDIPALGQKVRKGQLLGWIEPPLPAPDQAAMASNRLQVRISLAQLDEKISESKARLTEAASDLELSRTEKERVERLLGLKAVPEKRVQIAERDLAVAEAAFRAATDSHQTLLRAREGLQKDHAEPDTQSRFPLYAPGTGTVEVVRASSGAFVQSDEELYRIMDTGRVWITANIHESEVDEIRSASQASLELPQGGRIELTPADSRLLSIGSVVAPESRTIPMVWEVANSEGRLKIGMLLEMEIFTAERRNTLSVPSSAVLQEENKRVVYVQASGETFDRRIVQTGVAEPGWVGILSGLSEGERIVSVGGYEVSLAARSSGLPAGEGHVH